MFSRAQGTIEYLVVIGVVVISLVVVGLMTSLADNQSVSKTAKKIGAYSSAISVTDAAMDSNGDAIFVVRSNQGNDLTLSSIIVNGDSIPNTSQISQTSNSQVAIVGITSSCCAFGETGVNDCNVVFNYGTPNLENLSTSVIVSVACVSDVNVTSSSPEINEPPIPYQGSLPSVFLLGPDSGTSLSSFNFKFSVSGGEDVNSCFLLVDGQSKAIIQNPPRNLVLTAFLQDSSLSIGPHNWDVNCVSGVYSAGAASPRLFINPFTFGTISACGVTLADSNKYYWLTNNLSSAGVCISVAADDVYIDGNGLEGFSIIGSGTGNGINSTVIGAAAHNRLNLNNLIVEGFGSDVNATGYAAPSGNGFNGGSVLLRDSKINVISTFGGNALSASRIYGGNAGNVTLFDSNSTTINSYGGMTNDGYSGAGGNVYLNNAVVSTVNAYGGVKQGINCCNGGAGGSLTAIDSNVNVINTYGGGDIWNYGSNGGAVNLTNTIFRNIDAHGGLGYYWPSQHGGAGGNITITNDNINFNNVSINTDGGYSQTGGPIPTYDPAGKLTLKFKNSFTDIGSTYGHKISLKIDNNFGNIDWGVAQISSLAPFSSKILVSDNSAYVNSAVAPELNIGSDVTLYNIGNRGFAIPSLLKDGVNCSDCTLHGDLTDTNVWFTVTGWSTYSIGESTS